MPEIKNTNIEEVTDKKTGKIKFYRIYPKEGYKLHEKSRDEVLFDENGNETGEIKLGYTSEVVTAMANYDFEKNERDIYAVKEDEI